MKKWIAAAAALCVGASLLTACGGAGSSSSSAPAGGASVGGTDGKTYKIGIVQLVQHNALDAACQGFQDKLKASGLNVEFDLQNASGDQATCATIANKFVNDKKDLILAIATPAAQAAAQATKDIPILLTAVTDPAASKLVASNEKPGGNVSGTSDMNQYMQKQLELVTTLAPEAKTVGILYCSAEDNSIIQAQEAQKILEGMGLTVKVYTAADTNEIQAVTQKACGEVDAIYIPTDNTFASAMPTVSMVTTPAKIPVVCGEENMAMAGGLATYSVDYYRLGEMAAEQAIQILKDGAHVGDLPIGFASEADMKYVFNEEVAQAIGITIPENLK